MQPSLVFSSTTKTLQIGVQGKRGINDQRMKIDAKRHFEALHKYKKGSTKTRRIRLPSSVIFL